jgi:hypothetical protein
VIEQRPGQLPSGQTVIVEVNAENAAHTNDVFGALTVAGVTEYVAVTDFC